jgi:hypothetical protein
VEGILEFIPKVTAVVTLMRLMKTLVVVSTPARA